MNDVDWICTGLATGSVFCAVMSWVFALRARKFSKIAMDLMSKE